MDIRSATATLTAATACGPHKQQPQCAAPTDKVETGGRPVAELKPHELKAFVQAMPKVDLHRHMEGAITPELMVRIAHKYGIDLPTYDVEKLRPDLEVGPEDKTLMDFLKKFDTIGLAFKSEDAIREITYQTILDAAKDNVKYCEMRFSPVYMAQQYKLDVRDVMDAVVAGMEDARKDCDTKTNLIVIIERQMGVENGWATEKLAEEYMDRGVVALDLANNEYAFPPAPYAPVFQAAKAAGLKVTVHAGESSPTEEGKADNVKVSVEQLGADRIGHGVGSYRDPAVERLVIEKGIPLEMCPTSNFQTGASPSVGEYPMRRYVNNGAVVTVNTDDPAVSGIVLSDEYERVLTELGFTLPELETMVINGVRSAFVTSPEREAMERQFRDEFKRLEEAYNVR